MFSLLRKKIACSLPRLHIEKIWKANIFPDTLFIHSLVSPEGLLWTTWEKILAREGNKIFHFGWHRAVQIKRLAPPRDGRMYNGSNGWWNFEVKPRFLLPEIVFYKL